MTKTFEKDIHPLLEIEYFKEGILIKSKIDIATKNSSKNNYDVPIFVLPNKKFGFTIFHLDSQVKIYNVEFESLDFSKAMVMLNKTMNWWVFILDANQPNDINYRLTIKKELETGGECLQVYPIDNTNVPLEDVFAADSLSYGYGLGVE